MPIGDPRCSELKGEISMSTTDPIQLSNQSGGIDLQGETINIGGDVVGRDKIVSIKDQRIYNISTQAGSNAQIDIVEHHPQVVRQPTRPAPPRRPRGFIGRTAELAQLDQQISAHEALTLYAPDGAGKSALLKQAANSRAVPALPDGVAFLEGVDVDGTLLGPNDLIQRLFEKYFIADPALNVTADTAQPHLSTLQALIIIDGAQLPARLIERLPDICRECAIVVSNTQPPAGDATLPVKVSALQRADAVQLFAQRANLAVNETNQSALETICALLADVPLAVVISGNVVREAALTLEQVQLTLAAITVTTGDLLQAGIERAMQLAYSILTPEETSVVEMIAALPGLSHNPDRLRQLLGLEVDQRERIVETNTDVIIGTVKLKKRVPGPIGLPDQSSPSPDKYGAALERLQRLSVIYTNSPRLRLAPGLRPMIPTRSTPTWQERLLAQFLIDAQQNRFKSDQFCHDELGNVLGSIAWAAQQGHETAALELSRAISPHLTHFGLWDVWGSLLDRALQAARAIQDRHAEAWALHQLGTRTVLINQTDAIALLKQALELRRIIGDTAGAAITQHNLDVLIPPPIPPQETPQPPTKPSDTVPAAGGSLLPKFLVTIGVLLAVAGAVLLSGSVLVGPQPCDREVPVSAEAAREMAMQIRRVQQIASGERAALEFPEMNLNSYVREFTARSGDLQDGGIRLVEPGVVMLCGRSAQAGNLPIAAKFRIQPNADQAYQLEGVAAQVINTSGALGWVAVPNFVVEQLGLMDRVRAALGNNFRVTGLEGLNDQLWRLEIEGK
jgi:hypothetical protein